MNDITTKGFGLAYLDEEMIVALLCEHPKYLHNPITGSERRLIRDIVRVASPLTRMRPSPTNQIEGGKSDG